MEKKIQKVIKDKIMNKRKGKRKKLTIKIPRNSIKFKEILEYENVSPKIRHSFEIK